MEYSPDNKTLLLIIRATVNLLQEVDYRWQSAGQNVRCNGMSSSIDLTANHVTTTSLKPFVYLLDNYSRTTASHSIV